VNAFFGDIAEVAHDAVTLRDGRSARFAPKFALLLEELRRQGMPVYLELDESHSISRVRIPDIVRVEHLTGDSVTFTNSHGRYAIDRDLAGLLRAHRQRRLAVTTNDAGEIIDVRAYE
jgi:hypothetical protein